MRAVTQRHTQTIGNIYMLHLGIGRTETRQAGSGDRLASVTTRLTHCGGVAATSYNDGKNNHR